jgi:hypothetical protein
MEINRYLQMETEQEETTAKMTLPGIILRLEGLTVFIGAIAIYAHFHGLWWVFLLLLLAPDIFMLGYMKDTNIGAIIYNIGHFYALPALLLALSLNGDWFVGSQLAAIWFAHIGMDRVSGYGLKYENDFKDTHLGHV